MSGFFRGIDPRRPSLSLVALVAMNLVPLAGVLLAGWDAAMILLLYWSENLIIGAFNLLRMLMVRPRSAGTWGGKLFMIPFFCIHFGGFCAAHGLILLSLLGLGSFDEIGPEGPSGSWPGPLIFLQLLVGVVAQAWNARPPGSTVPFLALAASHGVSFVQHYVGKREFSTLTLEQLMGAPYGRIVVMHLAIFAGAVPIMALHSPVPMLCALVLLKIALDVRLHARSHAKGAPAPQPEVAS